jgi:hypothetical protein
VKAGLLLYVNLPTIRWYKTKDTQRFESFFFTLAFSVGVMFIRRELRFKRDFAFGFGIFEVEKLLKRLNLMKLKKK